MAFAKQPSQFSVAYYAVSPTGTQARFDRTTGLVQLRNNAKSETAVRSYLQKLHPRCDIQIINLEYR